MDGGCTDRDVACNISMIIALQFQEALPFDAQFGIRPKCLLPPPLALRRAVQGPLVNLLIIVSCKSLVFIS